MDLADAITQVEAVIAKLDAEVSTIPLDWSDTEGARNLRVKVLNHRRHSLLLALDALRAAQ